MKTLPRHQWETSTSQQKAKYIFSCWQPIARMFSNEKRKMLETPKSLQLKTNEHKHFRGHLGYFEKQLKLLSDADKKLKKEDRKSGMLQKKFKSSTSHWRQIDRKIPPICNYYITTVPLKIQAISWDATFDIRIAPPQFLFPVITLAADIKIAKIKYF